MLAMVVRRVPCERLGEMSDDGDSLGRNGIWPLGRTREVEVGRSDVGGALVDRLSVVSDPKIFGSPDSPVPSMRRHPTLGECNDKVLTKKQCNGNSQR